ncbi:MAG: hypothetical protein PHQ22_10465 [Sulfuricurvum sp.]|nr:hypothetical protein [Sulfuricurvum sp.]
MKRFAIALILVMLTAGVSFAYSDQIAYTEDVYCSESTTSWRQTSGATVYTRPIDVWKGGDYFAISYRAVSAASTPWLAIYMEQSDVLPATDGAADSNWATPSNVCIINEKLIDESVHIDAIYPVPVRYMRFKILDPNVSYDVISDSMIDFIKVHRVGTVR